MFLLIIYVFSKSLASLFDAMPTIYKNAIVCVNGIFSMKMFILETVSYPFLVLLPYSYFFFYVVYVKNIKY